MTKMFNGRMAMHGHYVVYIGLRGKHFVLTIPMENLAWFMDDVRRFVDDLERLKISPCGGTHWIAKDIRKYANGLIAGMEDGSFYLRGRVEWNYAEPASIIAGREDIFAANISRVIISTTVRGDEARLKIELPRTCVRSALRDLSQAFEFGVDKEYSREIVQRYRLAYIDPAKLLRWSQRMEGFMDSETDLLVQRVHLNAPLSLEMTAKAASDNG